MKTEKTINLTAYTVEYIDPREPKPRKVHKEIYVLDGGRISALHRLGINPGGYITQQYERRTGCTVTTVRKGQTLTAIVDLAELYHTAVTESVVQLAQRYMKQTLQRMNGEEVEE